MDDIDFELERGKGFFTAADKQFLVEGEVDDLDSHVLRQKRKRARDRTRNAIFDLQLAYRHLDDEDIAQIFDFSEAETYEAQMFERGIWCTLAFLYKALGREQFVDYLEEAAVHVETGRNSYSPFARLEGGVDVSIEGIEDVEVSELADKLNSQSIVELSNAEISVLFRLMQETGGTMPSNGEEFRELYIEFLKGEQRSPEDSAFKPPETGFPDFENIPVRKGRDERNDG